MTYIGVDKTDYQVENRSWLLGPHGTEPGANPTITLDISAFTEATHYPDGYIKSGEPLALLGSGLYGPYADASTEAGTLTRTSTAGDVRLIIDGRVTGEIPADAAGFTAAAVQAAIRALGADFAAVTVTGDAGGPLTVAFTGITTDVTVEVDNDDATGGTIVWATTTAGGAESPAGEGTGKGLLFSSTKVPDVTDTTKDVGAALLIRGDVKISKLPRDPGAAFWRDCPNIQTTA